MLGTHAGALSVVQRESGGLPRLRCELQEPVKTSISLVVRVHALNGIPVAYSPVEMSQGDRIFETHDLTLFAMEGYSHLPPAERQIVERRVWSRRAYAIASTA